MPRRPKFPESPDFSNLQGLRPWAFSRLVPGDVEWLRDDEEVGAGSSGSVVHWMKKGQDGNILDEVESRQCHTKIKTTSPYRIKGSIKKPDCNRNSTALDTKASCTSRLQIQPN
jgi:hypothetical protein